MSAAGRSNTQTSFRKTKISLRSMHLDNTAIKTVQETHSWSVCKNTLPSASFTEHSINRPNER